MMFDQFILRVVVKRFFFFYFYLSYPTRRGDTLFMLALPHFSNPPLIPVLTSSPFRQCFDLSSAFRSGVNVLQSSIRQLGIFGLVAWYLSVLSTNFSLVVTEGCLASTTLLGAHTLWTDIQTVVEWEKTVLTSTSVQQYSETHTRAARRGLFFISLKTLNAKKKQWSVRNNLHSRKDGAPYASAEEAKREVVLHRMELEGYEERSGGRWFESVAMAAARELREREPINFMSPVVQKENTDSLMNLLMVDDDDGDGPTRFLGPAARGRPLLGGVDSSSKNASAAAQEEKNIGMMADYLHHRRSRGGSLEAEGAVAVCAYLS